MNKLFRGIILGAPGSGKGTISSRIIRDFNLSHLSVGDLLRNEIQSKTTLGKEINSFIKEGKLVPDSLVNDLVIKKLQADFSKKSFLLDGFPRTLIQAQELNRCIQMTSCINLLVPDDEIIERIKNRWIHLPSGRIYHLKYNPPKKPFVDDLTGEKLLQREDDKEHIVMQRLLQYKQESYTIIEFYK